MRVRTKFISITLFVAAVPLLMSASQSIRLHEKTLNDILLQLHATSAELGAQAVEQHLHQTRGALENIVQATIDWGSLDANEKPAALQLLLSQVPDAQFVSLDQDGETIYVRRTDADGAHMPAEDDFASFRQVVPPADQTMAIGRPVRLPSGLALLPVSVSDHGRDGQLAATVGVGLALDGLCSLLTRAVPAQGSLFLLDDRGRVLCENGAAASSFDADPSLLGAVQGNTPSYVRTTASSELRGAVSRASDTFRVVVEQPMAVLAAPTRLLRSQVALWLAVGAVAAVISGFILGRSILGPLEQLAAAAAKIASGVFGERMTSKEFDAEFADVASSFNTMSAAIAERDGEIQAWNRELQTRIDLRSRELEAAQDALLSSRKMAGLSVTTAGVAHELNNPLTGVLGLAQVLMARLQKRGELTQNVDILHSIVGESKRMQALLDRMKVLNGEPEEGSYREVSCTTLLEGALVIRRPDFESLGIKITKHYPASTAHVWGHLERLHMVLVELTENAFRAIRESVPPGDGKLTFSVKVLNEDWVEIAVEDNGPGIPAANHSRVFEPFFTTKPGGVGQGLGLAQVYRMVEAHSGKVWVDPTFTGGCRIVVRLPRARVGAHLV